MKQFFLERRHFFCLLAPALFGLVYLFLCMVNSNQSVNLAESQNIYLTRFCVFDAIKNAPQSANLPFYYLVLNLLSHILGNAIYSMRLLSAIFGAASIFFAFKWAKYKYGAKAGILSTLFLSICPFMVFSGQSVQANTLIVLEAFASIYFLQLAIDARGKQWWFVYTAILILGLWTHLSFVLVLVAQLIYVISIYRKDFIRKKLFISFALAALAFIPGVVLSNLPQAFDTSLSTLGEVFSEMSIYECVGNLKGLALLLLIGNVSFVIYLFTKTKRKPIMPVLLAVVPAALLFVLSVVFSFVPFSSQWLAFVPAAFCVIISVLLAAQMNKRFKRRFLYRKHFRIVFGVLVFVTTSVIGIYNVSQKANYDFASDSRPAVNLLFENIDILSYENEPIVASSEELYYELSVYENSKHQVINSADDWGGLLENEKQFWYVSTGDETPPSDKLEIEEQITLNLDEYSPSYYLYRLSTR